HVRVPRVADAEVVPQERAARPQHTPYLAGHSPCDPVVEDRGEQGEAEREIEAGVAVGESRGVDDAEAELGPAGLRACDGVGANVDADEALGPGAPADQPGNHLAVPAAEVEHASVAEREAPGSLEQPGEDAGALVDHGPVPWLVRRPLARAAAALCISAIDAPHPSNLVRDPRLDGGELPGHHATAAGVPVGSSPFASSAHASADRARVQSKRSRA